MILLIKYIASFMNLISILSRNYIIWYVLVDTASIHPSIELMSSLRCLHKLIKLHMFSFPEGLQDPSHPNPGKPYTLEGFPRVAYLPNSPQGNKVGYIWVWNHFS